MHLWLTALDDDKQVEKQHFYIYMVSIDVRIVIVCGDDGETGLSVALLASLQVTSSRYTGLIPACLVYLPENKHLLPADRKPGEEPESLVGKQVEYVTDNGLKRTGLVIYQVPAKPTVYYIKYDDDVHIHVYDLVKTT